MTDPTFELEFPDCPDLPPPWLPNDKYLEWLRETWAWMKPTPQWNHIMEHNTDFVESPLVLP